MSKVALLDTHRLAATAFRKLKVGPRIIGK